MPARVILGISPGTRVMGLSVMRDGELMEWQVKSFKETWSFRKRAFILATISKLCEYHSVTRVIVKKVDRTRSSKELDRLIDAIIRQAERQRLHVDLVSLEDLDFERRKRKKDITEEMAAKYPELRADYEKMRDNRADYYTKMFEAVAIADYGDDHPV